MKLRNLIVCALLIAAACAQTIQAAEVDRRLRLSLMLGGHNTQGEISSDAANILTLIEENGDIADRYLDPRNDATIFGNLEIKPSNLATLSLQYGLTRFFLVEGSVGYAVADVGEVEVQEIFSGAIQRITVGELTRIPFQVSGLFRFRPEKNFNPYIGAGIGYTVIGHEPSDDFNQLSLNLDASTGRQGLLASERFGSGISLFANDPVRQLTGATIDARDTFEWQLAAGIELGFARNWAFVADLRYTFASRNFEVQFNDFNPVGISVPNTTEFIDAENIRIFGPLVFTEGGLLDVDGDGEVDTGAYYVQGGKLSYDGVQAQLGIRYSF